MVWERTPAGNGKADAWLLEFRRDWLLQESVTRTISGEIWPHDLSRSRLVHVEIVAALFSAGPWSGRSLLISDTSHRRR